MSCNQQLICVFNADRLDAHQRGCKHNSVVTVGRQRIWSDKPWQTFAAVPAEAYVVAKLLDRAAGFPTPQDMPFRCLLKFYGDVGSAMAVLQS